MNTQRLFPYLKCIGRSIVWKSDVFQNGIKAYNHNVQLGHNNFHGQSISHQYFDDKLNYSENILHRGKGSYLKIVSKAFSSEVQVFCREFSDGENEHAHDVLRSLPAYEATTVDSKGDAGIYFLHAFSLFTFKDKYWPAIGTDELVRSFTLISKSFAHDNCSLEEDRYNVLCISVKERIPYMSDDQLLTVLSAMSHWTPSQCNSSNFDMLWRVLDDACFNRLCSWDVSKLLMVSDHWYALRILKNSIFFTKSLSILGRNIKNLTPTQLVQYMFYVNLNRNLGFVKKNDLEVKLKDVLKFLSIEEIGIIAMALFKTRTNINDPEIIDTVMKTAIKNLDTVSDHCIGSILKLLHMCLPSNAHSQCYDFLESLNQHVDRLNNFVLLQMAIFGNNLLVFHREVMCKIATRFAQQISTLRLKDIERFSYSLMLYKFVPPACPDIVNIIINELRQPERIAEINHFPRCFTSCVNYLVTMGVFPHDLISAALQPSMIQLLKSTAPSDSDNMGREMNELNWTMKIELCPNYLGYYLDEFQSEVLTKNYMGELPSKNNSNLSHQQRLMLDIQSKLSAVMGMERCVEPAFILPHFFTPDLVFCTTKEGDPVQLPSQFKLLPFHALKTIRDFEQLGLLWNAVIVGGRNSYIRNTKELKGSLEMKKRQLNMLGYRVSVVPYTDYVKTSMKYKVQCLERSLMNTSSLNLDGRKEMAIGILKSGVQTNNQEIVRERAVM